MPRIGETSKPSPANVSAKPPSVLSKASSPGIGGKYRFEVRGLPTKAGSGPFTEESLAVESGGLQIVAVWDEPGAKGTTIERSESLLMSLGLRGELVKEFIEQMREAGFAVGEIGVGCYRSP